MSSLEIFAEDNASTVLFRSDDGDVMASQLAAIGVRFERWTLRAVDDGDVLAAYAEDIEALQAINGYRTVDVVSMTPDHPERHTLRKKFLSEHRHAENEIRFFVRGNGLFTLHPDHRVWNVRCEAGDLISVPAGMRHWFDAGPRPDFTAIRLFMNPDGWVAAFTGDPVSDRFVRDPDV